MLEIDEIIALLRLDGMELDLGYFVKNKKYTAYIEQPYNPGTGPSVHCVGTGDTETEAANDAWKKYVNERMDCVGTGDTETEAANDAWSAYENSGRNHSVD